MSTHLYACEHNESGYNCDLDGPRHMMCETCLTYLVRRERPPGWSPRVKKEDKPNNVR